MNKQKERYQEAVKRLPEIEEQIARIMQFKEELALGNVSGLNVMMLGNTKNTKQKNNDTTGMITYGEMVRRTMFPWVDPVDSNLPKTSSDSESKLYTGEIEINEILAAGICEAMLQILTEERNILIARIKSLV